MNADCPLPKYVARDRDRHGNERYYFRRGGRKVRLFGQPGTSEFLGEVEQLAGGVFPKARRVESAREGSAVYFVLHGNKRVKIGTSEHAKARYAAIRRSVPGKARILYVTPGDRNLERQLHRQFAEDRVNGEWFVYSKAIREWIRADEARRWKERGAGT